MAGTRGITTPEEDMDKARNIDAHCRRKTCTTNNATKPATPKCRLSSSTKNQSQRNEANKRAETVAAASLPAKPPSGAAVAKNATQRPGRKTCRDRANLLEGGIILCFTVLSAVLAWGFTTSKQQQPPSSELILDLDLRSLAVGRMALGGVVLWDLSERLQDVPRFYGDQGCCPRHVVLRGGDPRLRSTDFSIYFAVGSNAFVKAFMAAVGGISSFCLIIGYSTSKAAFACWVHWRSIETRNGVIHQAGDLLIRGILWWSMFLPLGACWSVDSALGSQTFSPCSRLAAFGLIQQMACVYFFTALFKVDESWTCGVGGSRTASAIRLVLSNFGFSREPFSQWLLVATSSLFPSVDGIWLLTRISWWLEFCALPLLLGFIPFVPSRLLAVVLFIGFHVGIALTMRIGVFPVACISGWIFLTPSCFWEYWMIPMSFKSMHDTTPLLANIRGNHYLASGANNSLVADMASSVVMMLSIALALRSNLSRLVIYRDGSRLNVVASNIKATKIHNKGNVMTLFATDLLWRPLRVSQGPIEIELCRLLGQHQQWFMFDKPARKDCWYVSVGHCVDGSVLDVFGSVFEKKLLPPTLQSPPPPWRVAYRSHRWIKFFSRLLESSHGQFRRTYAEYISRMWNNNLAPSPNKRVIKVEMRCVVRTLLADTTSAKEEVVSLWSYDLA